MYLVQILIAIAIATLSVRLLPPVKRVKLTGLTVPHIGSLL